MTSLIIAALFLLATHIGISSAGLHAGRAFHGVPAASVDTSQRSGDLKA